MKSPPILCINSKTLPDNAQYALRDGYTQRASPLKKYIQKGVPNNVVMFKIHTVLLWPYCTCHLDSLLGLHCNVITMAHLPCEQE